VGKKMKCSKAWAKFQKYVNHRTGYSVPWHDYNALSGYMYSFFDNEKIIISVDVYLDYDEACKGNDVYMFDWEIFTGGDCYDSDIVYDSRPKAEDDAFQKAYDILEERL
jgi:hypothetical protein